MIERITTGKGPYDIVFAAAKILYRPEFLILIKLYIAQRGNVNERAF